MKYLRWLLFPFSILYGLAVTVRNFFYDSGLIKSKKFNKPVIAVGNLDVGGAGKSPMTEYLVRLLKDEFKVATLSRGYGRQTKGFLIAANPATAAKAATATNLGDEPAQFKHKFPDITVAVCERRVEGIEKLLPGHEVILLDDAYQHRAVEPGLSILLFDYTRLIEPRLLLPAGNLREPFSGRWRAQVIVITKCPPNLSEDERYAAIARVEPLPYQQVFFTSIEYQQPQSLAGPAAPITIEPETTIFLLTGIANPKPLLKYLEAPGRSVVHHDYPDHHQFTLKNITKLAIEFSASPVQKKVIITTEKDAQRLQSSWFTSALGDGGDLPVFVLPIAVDFLNDGGEKFNHLITTYVREHTTYNSLH